MMPGCSHRVTIGSPVVVSTHRYHSNWVLRQVLSWSPAPMSAGDCRMQNAKLNVMTNGKAIFTAQVMTTHTT